MHNLYQAPPTALVSGHDIGTNGGSRRFGSQEALSIAEEDEDRDSNADGEYITKSTVSVCCARKIAALLLTQDFRKC